MKLTNSNEFKEEIKNDIENTIEEEVKDELNNNRTKIFDTIFKFLKNISKI